MGDAAHFELLEHEIFQKPFKVKPVPETWDTPRNYRRYPGGNELPDKMKVWLVQKIGKERGSSVSWSKNFDNSPDNEVLVKGYTIDREYGAPGVARHGNFLQWGYSAPPSKMTEPGGKLFLNCINYIHKFNGEGVWYDSAGQPR